MLGTAAALLAVLSAPQNDNPTYAVAAWECRGSVEPGREWRGAFLSVSPLGVEAREVVLRFASPALPADEARWFETPRVLGVASITAWRRFCEGECERDSRASVEGDAWDAVLRRVHGEGDCRDVVSVDLDGRRTTHLARIVRGLTFRSGSSGFAIHDLERPITTPCTNPGFAGRIAERRDIVDERHDLVGAKVESLGSDPRGVPAGEDLAEIQKAASAVLRRLLGRLGALAPEPGGVGSGAEAARLGAYLVADLDGLCDVSGDDGDEGRRGFPGEFAMYAAIAAPVQAADAASVEVEFSRNLDDQELALRILGDRPAPRHRGPILRALEVALRRADPVDASLALRALVKADPDAARARALPLLHDDALWRSAAGVFALTEPHLERRLTEAGSVGRDEVIPAVLGFLAEQAHEPEIRERARALLDEAP